MDDQREEREELAADEREAVDEAREQEDARRFWTCDEGPTGIAAFRSGRYV